MKLKMFNLLRFPVLLMFLPFGLMISIVSAIRGWDNGRFWWREWKNIWMDRPPSDAIRFELE